MDLNKYINKAAPPEPQYSKEEYAAIKKAERDAVWAQVDARMGEVLADGSALQGFLSFMSQCRSSLPNQLLLSSQKADITDARTFQQWKDAGRHIRTGEEGYTAIVGQVYENNGRKTSGYNIGKVFDVTQTRGRPVPPPVHYEVEELIAAAIESMFSLEMEHYLKVSGLEYSYDKFYQENIPNKCAWARLRGKILAELPRQPQDFAKLDITTSFPKLWQKRQRWEQKIAPPNRYRGEER